MIYRDGQTDETFLVPESEIPTLFVPTESPWKLKFSPNEDPDVLRQFSTIHTLGWPSGVRLEPPVCVTRILFFTF